MRAASGNLLLRGRVVTPSAVLADGVVAASGGRLTWVGPAARWPGEGPLPQPTGLTVLPGLVDVHCHGGGGSGFPDTGGGAGAGAEGARAAARHHRGAGTTTLLASLVSAPAEVLLRQVEVLADLVEAGEVAGTHLEGPFLSLRHCGAQDPASVVPGDPVLLEALLDRGRGTIRSVTLAPETARSAELRAVLAGAGVLASLGHTGASGTEVRRWVSAWTGGAGTPLGVTHLFNGMPPWLSRAPGPVPACLAAAAHGEAVVELVGDGVHLDDETVAAVFDLVGPGQVALVTDATAAAGMPDGRYRLGALDVEVTGGVARLTGPPPGGAGPDDPAGAPRSIAGGTADLLAVVRRTATRAGVDLAAAVAAASATPARLLGLDADRGALETGRCADVLVVDDALRPVAVAVDGTWVDQTRNPEEVPWRS